MRTVQNFCMYLQVHKDASFITDFLIFRPQYFIRREKSFENQFCLRSIYIDLYYWYLPIGLYFFTYTSLLSSSSAWW